MKCANLHHTSKVYGLAKKSVNGPCRRTIPVRRMSQSWVLQLQQMLTTPRWHMLRESPGLPNTEDFVDTGTSTAELRDANILKSGDVNYARLQVGRMCWTGTNKAELATLEATGTWEQTDAPRERNLEGSCRIRRVKDITVADVERDWEPT